MHDGRLEPASEGVVAWSPEHHIPSKSAHDGMRPLTTPADIVPYRQREEVVATATVDDVVSGACRYP
jgi:hypothetical protein